jgi:non-ribosomal peptide synthetase component E (peptide arylation enzyme)
MDQDGYCSIVGRITDMIIRGGENVYAFEIEQIIYHHPDVKDVYNYVYTMTFFILDLCFIIRALPCKVPSVWFKDFCSSTGVVPVPQHGSVSPCT